MPKSNTRFAVVWALLLPVITGAILLVGPLDIASWTDTQTALTVALANATSAFILAAIAFFWTKSVTEPAALSAGMGAFLISVFTEGNGFRWWDLDQRQQNLILAFAGSVLLLIVGLVTRQSVYAPETVKTQLEATAVEVATAKAVDPAVHAK